MSEVDTQEYHPEEHYCIEEVHHLDEGLCYYAADAIWIIDLEDWGQVLGSDCLHGQVEGEQEDGWG